MFNILERLIKGKEKNNKKKQAAIDYNLTVKFNWHFRLDERSV